MTSPRSVLFRCDAWPEIGFGHIVRCLALADELREAHGCQITFAMLKGTAGCSMVEERGYKVLDADRDDLIRDYAGWLEESINEARARALVLDIRDDLPIPALEALKKKGIFIATIDDPSNRRLVADIAFYPPVPQVKETDWSGFSGELYCGWDYVLLRRDFSHPARREVHEVPTVLVTMGGSDPCGLTLKAIQALDLLDEDFKTVVLLGPGFLHHEALNELVLRSRRKFDLLQGVRDIPGLMAEADLALGSFGVTAYELAAMGVPGVYMCLTEDHARSASAFVEAGMALSLGVHDAVSPEMLASATSRLLSDRTQLENMLKSALKHVDGKGVRRVANEIEARITYGSQTVAES